jgi:tetratricopeptide (TPR) repeat protein
MMRVRTLPWLAVLAVAFLASAGANNRARAQQAPPMAEPEQNAPQVDPKSDPKAEKADQADNAARVSGLPKTPAERDRVLAELYAELADAEDLAQAKAVEGSLERVWLYSGSATVDLLFARAMQAVAKKDFDRALLFLDHVVEQAPDFTEAWSRRAFIHFQRNEVSLALGDLRRAIALDPSNFKVLDGLSQVLRDIGEKEGSLKVLRRLLEVHPHWPGAERAVEDLAREVEGQPL